MKYRISKTLLLIPLFIALSSFTHPVKLTACLVEYQKDKKVVHAELKVFIDDFLASVKKAKGVSININNVKEKEAIVINQYINDDFKILLNEKEVNLSYNDLEINPQFNVAIFKFDFKVQELKKGMAIEVSNSLFFKDFGYMQSNRCTLRVPPFIEEENYEFTLNGNAGVKKVI